MASTVMWSTGVKVGYLAVMLGSHFTAGGWLIPASWTGSVSIFQRWHGQGFEFPALPVVA
jgi:hypothetical protein